MKTLIALLLAGFSAWPVFGRASFGWTDTGFMSQQYVAAGSSSTLANGLVGYWKFNESSGTAADSSGSGNAGTLTGASAAFAAGKFGNAVSFTSSDHDYVAMGNPAALQVTVGSVACWFACSDTNQNTYSALVSKMNLDADTGGYALIRGKANIIRLELATASGYQFEQDDAAFVATTNVWYHVAATWDGTHAIIYTNGVQALSILQTRVPASTVNNFRVGSDAVWSGAGFDGWIDEIRVWNRALTSSEVTELYNTVP